MISRRGFLKLLGFAGGLFLLSIPKLASGLSKTNSTSGCDDPEKFDIWGGFVLLEEDAYLPSFVEIPATPILGEVDRSQKCGISDQNLRGDIIWFRRIEDLRNAINCPIYVLQPSPERLTFIQGYILRFSGSGEVFHARLDYGKEGDLKPLISTCALLSFPQPYPIWPTKDFSEENAEESILLNPFKIDYTPSAGLFLPTREGFLLHWIKNRVLYSVFVEHEAWRNKGEQIAKLLIEV